ncbi:BrnT family toxin [bacterium]|nr:MAG: BrnT family toxin [bacterium]
MEFEWDPKKAAKNLRKHRVSFSEATTVCGDLLGTTVPDPDHSLAEDRYITVGMSSRRRLVIVAHTERGERIRIISARELTRAEREAYEEETQK